MTSGTLTALLLTLAAPAFAQTTPPEFSTYIGDINHWTVAAVRADSAGNTYVAGNRSSGTLSELFAAKLDRTGAMTSFTAFGGNGTDTVSALALDSAGNLYLAGSTSSTSFPVYNAMQPAPGAGFIVKVDGRTWQILYATYFPAAIAALAVDNSGAAYVTGTTSSSTFPTTAGLPPNTVGGGVPQIYGAFLTKISAAGDRIVYSTVFAGSNKPCGCCSSCFLSTRHTTGAAIAVDSAGNAYLAGNSDATDLPTAAGAFLQGGIGAFAAKVNAAGTALGYLTYIGSANYILSPYNTPGNTASAIAADSTGAVYLTGATSDPAFPVTAGTYQTAFAGPAVSQPYPPPASDAFVLKLKPDGTGVVWATYLGGKGVDFANSVALDGSGNVWLSGSTASADFPNAQGWSQGGDFLAALNPAATALVYSARYPNGTVAQSIAIDGFGAIHAAGSGGLVCSIVPSHAPTARIFGIANSAYGSVGGKMARGELISIYGPHIGPATPAEYTADASGRLPTTLGGAQIQMSGYALPLLYVSDSQINAVAPFSLYGSAAGLSIQPFVNGAAGPAFPFASIDADPEIFQNADGTAVAINQDGSVNSATHGAPAGSIVSIWLTGIGTSSAYFTDGQIAASAYAFTCCTVYTGSSGTVAPIVYSGSAPGAVAGVVQINFVVPASVVDSPDEGPPIYVWVTAGGATSTRVILYTAR